LPTRDSVENSEAPDVRADETAWDAGASVRSVRGS